jgi:hypothetical protein
MTRKIELLAGYGTLAGDCYAMGPSEIETFPLHERVEAATSAGYVGLGLVHQDFVHNAKLIGYPRASRARYQMRRRDVDRQVRCRQDGRRLRQRMRRRPQGWGDSGDGDPADEQRANARDGEGDRRARGRTQRRSLPRHLALRAGRDRFCEDQDASRDDDQLGRTRRRRCRAERHVMGRYVAPSPLPGEGSFDCPAFIDAMEQAGFRSFYGVEIINETYRRLPLREQAERSFKGTMAQFAKVADRV